MLASLPPNDVVERYKSLADIERGFRVLKSEIEIGPVYHRLPDRIRAHAAICFMALILYRVMRERLRATSSGLSPERALSLLGRIQHHRVTLNETQPVSGISSISPEQTGILTALGVKKPTANAQLTLLSWSVFTAPHDKSMTYAFTCRTRVIDPEETSSVLRSHFT